MLQQTSNQHICSLAVQGGPQAMVSYADARPHRVQEHRVAVHCLIVEA